MIKFRYFWFSFFFFFMWLHSAYLGEDLTKLSNHTTTERGLYHAEMRTSWINTGVQTTDFIVHSKQTKSYALMQLKCFHHWGECHPSLPFVWMWFSHYLHYTTGTIMWDSLSTTQNWTTVVHFKQLYLIQTFISAAICDKTHGVVFDRCYKIQLGKRRSLGLVTLDSCFFQPPQWLELIQKAFLEDGDECMCVCMCVFSMMSFADHNRWEGKQWRMKPTMINLAFTESTVFFFFFI